VYKANWVCIYIPHGASALRTSHFVHRIFIYSDMNEVGDIW